jgi:hypothetical protein
MSIKDTFHIRPITKEDYAEWLIFKHYAHRLPSISYAFGLYDDNKNLSGVLTFGMPPNYREMQAWQPFDLLELNRLVVNDGLPKNTTSFFVSSCIKLLPTPIVLISYADFRMGHHGYIYQATNWIYTGIGGEGQKIYVLKTGEERHQRHEKTIKDENVDHIEKTQGKARYYYFSGNKKEKDKMLLKLRFPVLPYPKGDNKRYDTSYKPAIQQVLF